MIHLKVIRPNLWLVGGSLSSPAPRDSLRKTQSLQHTAVLFMSPPTAKWNSLFYKTRTESRQRTNPVLPALRWHIVPLHTVTSGCHYMHHGRMPGGRGGGVSEAKCQGAEEDEHVSLSWPQSLFSGQERHKMLDKIFAEWWQDVKKWFEEQTVTTGFDTVDLNRRSQ